MEGQPLARIGVSFTRAQIDRINELISEGGHEALVEAQQMILDELEIQLGTTVV